MEFSNGTMIVTIATILAVLFIGCASPAATTPIQSANVTASLESISIRSGSSTILTVDAMNNCTEAMNGTFLIIPENDQILVQPREEAFTLGTQESTGIRRYNLTAYATSIRQDIQVTVNFVEPQTKTVLGSTTLTLNVYK